MIDTMAKPRKSTPATTPADSTKPPEDERIRMIVDTDEVVRQAITMLAIKKSFKQKRRVSNSEVVNEILRDAPELAEEIRGLSKAQ